MLQPPSSLLKKTIDKTSVYLLIEPHNPAGLLKIISVAAGKIRLSQQVQIKSV